MSRRSRSHLAYHAQFLRPLALVALDLGRALAPRLRPRRSHLLALRRTPPAHRAAHRCSRRAQDPQRPRPTHRASTTRADALARTARASPEPVPLAPPSTLLDRDPRQPSRLARIQRARTTAPADLASLATPAHRAPSWSRAGPELAPSWPRAGPERPLDGSHRRGEPPPRGRRRPPPAEIIRLDFVCARPRLVSRADHLMQRSVSSSPNRARLGGTPSDEGDVAPTNLMHVTRFARGSPCARDSVQNSPTSGGSHPHGVPICGTPTVDAPLRAPRSSLPLEPRTP